MPTYLEAGKWGIALSVLQGFGGIVFSSFKENPLEFSSVITTKKPSKIILNIFQDKRLNKNITWKREKWSDK